MRVYNGGWIIELLQLTSCSHSLSSTNTDCQWTLQAARTVDGACSKRTYITVALVDRRYVNNTDDLQLLLVEQCQHKGYLLQRVNF